MKTVYHYTDQSGFQALSSGATWYPSTGTAIPLNPSTSFADHIQAAIIRASIIFFREQYETRDYTRSRSSHFPDVYYGPGWYVTEIPPDTSSEVLLQELWQGRADYVDRTHYWLKIITEERRLKLPDSNRNTVLYLPIYEKLGGDVNRPAGESIEPVILVEAGSRSQGTDHADIQVLHDYRLTGKLLQLMDT